MTNQTTQSLVESRFSNFAAKMIAPHAESLRQTDSIPDDLWTAMGANGLFGLGLPPEAGGQGCDVRTISDAGRALARSGGNLGVALSWLMHEMTACFPILRFGNPGQHQAWLPELATGNITASFAVSEPGAGAHPKHLKTTAVKDGDDYRINGEKIYLTNGPIAGLFIVFAITGEDAGRKKYTAFIVPKRTPGLRVETIPLGFLRPSPHGRIFLENCRVPASQILGPVDGAYEAMVLPFREIEDILMMGPVLGGMEFLIDQWRSRAEGDQKMMSLLFDTHIAISGLRVVAREAADMLGKGSDPDLRTELTLYFRRQSTEVFGQLEQAAKVAGEEDSPAEQMMADFAAIRGIRDKISEVLKKKSEAIWRAP